MSPNVGTRNGWYLMLNPWSTVTPPCFSSRLPVCQLLENAADLFSHICHVVAATGQLAVAVFSSHTLSAWLAVLTQ